MRATAPLGVELQSDQVGEGWYAHSCILDRGLRGAHGELLKGGALDEHQVDRRVFWDRGMIHVKNDVDVPGEIIEASQQLVPTLAMSIIDQEVEVLSLARV